MTAPPTFRTAPWTVWLAAACIWCRAPIGLLAAVGVFVTGFDPRYQVDGGYSGVLMAAAFGFLLLSITWIVVSVSLLRRRRWAGPTAIVFDALSALYGAFAVFVDGSPLIGGIFLVFGSLALIVLLLRPSVDWRSE